MHYFHLLLVDDHENILFTFRLALESDGYDVDAASTISEARTKMEARYYDALILDLRLGTESGLTLLSGLRAIGTETPVLMMTAHGTPKDAVAAMKLGAVDFLSKLIEPVHFHSVVAEVLKRRLPSPDKAPPVGDKTYERQITEAKYALNCRDFASAPLYLARALELNSHSADAHYRSVPCWNSTTTQTEPGATTTGHCNSTRNAASRRRRCQLTRQRCHRRKATTDPRPF